MEVWDGYLRNGSLANKDLVRGEHIPNGLYHLVSEILVKHIMRIIMKKIDYLLIMLEELNF